MFCDSKKKDGSDKNLLFTHGTSAIQLTSIKVHLPYILLYASIFPQEICPLKSDKQN